MKNQLFKTIVFLTVQSLIINLQSVTVNAQWTPLTSGTTNTLEEIYAFSPDTVIVVGDLGTILRTTDGGASWTDLSLGITDYLEGVHFPSDTGYIVTRNGDVYISYDRGVNWSLLSIAVLGIGEVYEIHFTSTDCGYVVGFWVGTGGTQLGNTTDGGSTWTGSGGGSEDLRSVFASSADNVWAVGLHSGAPGLVWGGACTSCGVGCWSNKLENFSSNPLRSVYFVDNNLGFIVGDLGKIFTTTTGGITSGDWSLQTSGTTDNLYDVFFLDSLSGYAVGQGGIIIKTTDQGANWIADTSPTVNDLNDVFFVNGVGYAVGANGTILKYSSPCINFNTTVSATDVLCTGDSTGTAIVTPSGGTPPYTYLWSTGDTTDSIGNLAVATYTVTVTDSNSCTISDSVIINEPPPLSTSILSLNATLPAASDGYANLFVYGGAQPYTYNWSNADTTEDITALSAGTYTVTVTDSNGCQTTDSVDITEPLPVSQQIAFQKTYGGINPDEGHSVQQTADGGYIIGGYSNSFGANDGDVYLLKIDSIGDTLWSKTYGGSAVDYGRSVQQTTDGGYVIAGHSDFGPFSGGDQYIVKTDVNGTLMWSKAIGEGASDISYSIQQTADGGYIVSGTQWSFTGGLDLYLIRMDTIGNIIWARSYGGGSFKNHYGRSVQQTTDGGFIIAGETNRSGNYDIFLVKINANGDTLWTKTYGGSSWDVGYSVQQTADGGFIIAGETTSFGPGDFDVYLIKTNPTGDTLWTKTYGGTGSDMGYSVQQTSDGGYIITGETGSFGVGGDVYLIKTNSNGDALWTKTYGGANSDYGRSVQQTSDGGYIITGHTNSFGAGSDDVYMIKTDANGNTGICYEGNPATIVNNPATLVNSLSFDITSTGTSINPPTVVYNASPGVSELLNMSVSITSYSDVSCNGGSDGSSTVSIVSGGYGPFDYFWSSGDSIQNTVALTNSITNLSANTYTVTVIDAHECAILDTVAIDEPLLLTTSILVTDVTCNGSSDGAADLTVSGGTPPYSYLWSTGDTTQNVSSLPIGLYSVVVTDSLGCIAADSVNIIEPIALVISIITTDVSCVNACDGTASTSILGGNSPYTYLWGGGQTSSALVALCDTTYTINVIDSIGCVADDTASVAISNNLTAVITGVTPASCIAVCDGIASAFATGGTTPYSYQWNDPSSETNSIASSLCGGSYDVIVTDSVGCKDTATATITSQLEIVLTVTTNDANCGVADGNALVVETNGTGPYDYSWSSGDTTDYADSLGSGVYIVIVTDVNGCSSSAPALISDIGGPSLIDVVTNVTCNGGSDGGINIFISMGTPPYNYQWSNGSATQNISGLSAGPYEVNVTDAAGCVATQSIVVTEPLPISLSVSTTDASCGTPDGTAAVSASGGTGSYTYLWETGGTTLTEDSLMAGVYSVTVTDANGCVDSANADLSNVGGPIITVDSTVDISCSNPVGGSVYMDLQQKNRQKVKLHLKVD